MVCFVALKIIFIKVVMGLGRAREGKGVFSMASTGSLHKLQFDSINQSVYTEYVGCFNTVNEHINKF